MYTAEPSRAERSAHNESGEHRRHAHTNPMPPHNCVRPYRWLTASAWMAMCACVVPAQRTRMNVRAHNALAIRRRNTQCYTPTKVEKTAIESVRLPLRSRRSAACARTGCGGAHSAHMRQLNCNAPQSTHRPPVGQSDWRKIVAAEPTMPRIRKHFPIILLSFFLPSIFSLTRSFLTR